MRRGAVLSPHYIPRQDFTPHADQHDGGIYGWSEHLLNNYFCRSCGVFTYIGDGHDNKDGYRVNLGRVEGLGTMSLEVPSIDGQSIPIATSSR